MSTTYLPEIDEVDFNSFKAIIRSDFLSSPKSLPPMLRRGAGRRTKTASWNLQKKWSQVSGDENVYHSYLGSRSAEAIRAAKATRVTPCH